MKYVLLLLCAVICASHRHHHDNHHQKRVFLEHEAPIEPSPEWIQLGRAAPEDLITLSLALKLRNLDELESLFWSVSDIESKDYGKWLTFSELNKMVAPSQKSIRRITRWLHVKNHIKKDQIELSPNGDYIHVRISVETAEKLLSTQFFTYQHREVDLKLIRTPGPYSVPKRIAKRLDFIGGTIRLPSMRDSVNQLREINQLNLGLNPPLIKQSFNMPADIAGVAKNNSQAVAQFDVYQQYFGEEDLLSFQKKFKLARDSPQIIGSNDADEEGIEAMLDIEYIMGMGQGIPTWFVTTNGTADGGQEPFLQWISTMKSRDDAPWVHSVSYGDAENTVSVPYVKRVNAEFMIFGISGRTLFFSSGDDGAGCNNASTGFEANFPATSPCVTAVGGIYLNSTNGFVGDYISSGGFSTIFPAPSYQDEAVEAYLDSNENLPPSSLYNKSNRAFPDICSFSENVEIFYAGGSQQVAGTSCASPVVAGIFSLINDARLMAGKKTLGFLNPTLYKIYSSNPDIFFDVTSGGNFGCQKQSGYTCSEGWDPVTGLGAPNFPNLAKALLALP